VGVGRRTDRATLRASGSCLQQPAFRSPDSTHPWRWCRAKRRQPPAWLRVESCCTKQRTWGDGGGLMAVHAQRSESPMTAAPLMLTGHGVGGRRVSSNEKRIAAQQSRISLYRICRSRQDSARLQGAHSGRSPPPATAAGGAAAWRLPWPPPSCPAKSRHTETLTAAAPSGQQHC